LEALRALVAIGLVTDGDPAIQRSKLRQLGLERSFNAVVYSDEFGRAHRKPHPVPFRSALQALGVAPGEALYIGDRPDKDVSGASAAGMRVVRVLTGEYATVPDDVAPWARAASVAEAIRLVLPFCGRRAPPAAPVGQEPSRRASLPDVIPSSVNS
jgi:putative hydrolase of the HAD superfamily